MLCDKIQIHIKVCWFWSVEGLL